MKKEATQSKENLRALLAEASARANYKEDLELIRKTYDLKSQREMAEFFGVSQSTIFLWLKGEFVPKCLITIHFTAEMLRNKS